MLSVILVENVSGDKGYPITVVPMPLAPLFEDDTPASAGRLPHAQHRRADTGAPAIPPLPLLQSGVPLPLPATLHPQHHRVSTTWRS